MIFKNFFPKVSRETFLFSVMDGRFRYFLFPLRVFPTDILSRHCGAPFPPMTYPFLQRISFSDMLFQYRHVSPPQTTSSERFAPTFSSRRRLMGG